ncbi:MAG: peptide chain release factor-like protein [Phycisphaeraceae bacterium]|nr:peptide chain release factor-like protein [Phycisphaeraceae bacterium]
MRESIELHPAGLEEGALLRQCVVTRGRKGGPGGQHRNKVETAVEILHKPTGMVGQASERRSQEENRRVALFRLRVRLAIEVRRVLPLEVGASAMWRARCVKGVVKINPEHAEFPAMLAEAMDHLATRKWEPGVAGRVLGCTGSQLVKLLRVEAGALERVNAERRKRGERELK